MSRDLLEILLAWLVLMIGVFGMIILLPANDNTATTEVVNQDTCEHDWVISSEWSFWGNSYKTVSKCSKCGKVVR